MPPEGFKDRTLTIYFDSKKELNDLVEAASKAKLSNSQFAQEMIRRGMAQPTTPDTTLIEESTRAREELTKLRHELKDKSAAMEKMETELFALRHSVFANERLAGELAFSHDLVEFLQDGRIRRSDEIMKALQIDSKNIDAIKILSGQLRALRHLKLIEEGPRGWKWIR
ncbi:MAG: hypothetical protein AB9879_09645 [Methanothrix sp.]